MCGSYYCPGVLLNTVTKSRAGCQAFETSLPKETKKGMKGDRGSERKGGIGAGCRVGWVFDPDISLFDFKQIQRKGKAVMVLFAFGHHPAI